jgi:hypothetical protein
MEPIPSKVRIVHEGDDPSFWNEFMNFILSVQFIFVFHASPKILSYWVVEIVLELKSTSRGGIYMHYIEKLNWDIVANQKLKIRRSPLQVFLPFGVHLVGLFNREIYVIVL